MRFVCLTVVILCLLSATSSAVHEPGHMQFNLATIDSSDDILGGPTGLHTALDFFGGEGTNEPKDIDIELGTVTFEPTDPDGGDRPGGFFDASTLLGDPDVNAMLSGSNFSATTSEIHEFWVTLSGLVPGEPYRMQIFGYAVNSVHVGRTTINEQKRDWDSFTDFPENGGTNFARVLIASWIQETCDLGVTCEEEVRFGGGGPGIDTGGIAGLIVHQLASPDDFPIPAVQCSDCSWRNDSAGDWNRVDNWFSEEPIETVVPNDNTRTAVFGSAISTARTVLTDTDVTVKGIVFDNTNRYVIVGAGNVNLEADSGDADISVIQGSHQFQTVVNLASDTDLFTASGTTLVFNNALNLQGRTFTKTGDGTMELNNRVAAAGGTIDCQSGGCIGSGTVGGDLNNSGGTVSPGNSPGVLEVAGDFTQGDEGTLLMEVSGDVPGSEYDVLVVYGTADLAGTLEVSLLDGFTPELGDSFDMLELGSVTGTFDEIQLPELGGGLAWDLANLYDSGTLAVTSVPEPATFLLLLVSTVGIVFRVRRSSVKMND